MVRTPSYDRNGMKKGTWTAEEDSKLIDYISKHGCSNWRQLPKHAGLSRCGKSCRLRWMNYLRPNVRRGNYSKEEDELILKLHESLGNRWSAIASHLPGRTDNEIKNHWHASLKNRSASSKPTPSFDNTLKGARNEEDKEKEVLDIQAMLDKVNVNILESSPISTLPQVSSTISSSSNTLSSMENSVKLLVEDDACSNQVLEVEATGDFWTEPFWEDKDIMHSSSDLFLEPLFEHGIFYPPSPLDNEESYLFYGMPDQQDHNGFQYVNGFQW